MEDFLSVNQMYIVLVIVLLIWGGIVSYLFRLDKRIKDIEKAMQPKADEPLAQKKG
ncbi:MAG: CcmD family protein [Ignavibacteriales bacterium]|nr:CcmD family protein [Ignavibacteriales bacterium]